LRALATTAKSGYHFIKALAQPNAHSIIAHPFTFCSRHDPQENTTWEAAMWLLIIGIAFVWFGVLTGFVTVVAQEWQPIAHNISMFGSVLELIGLICFAFGFDNTRTSRSEYAPCTFCGEKTDVTQLEDCAIGLGMVLVIVGVVTLFIAGVLGWSVNHRADAPKAYRERTYTGRRKNSQVNFRKPNRPTVAAGPGAGGDEEDDRL
jgi:hypothetical protein